MTLKEIYKYLEEVGTLTFATTHNGEVHLRIAHFNGYDEEGLYLRTMANKPYGRQLLETGKLSVCGVKSEPITAHDENGVPEFPPGFTIRLIGEVKKVSEAEIREKATTNDMFKLAAYDLDKYPAMREGNFVLHNFKGEIFDYDFGCTKRDHKLLRTRFSHGGMTYNQAGPVITDVCIECGLCKDKCSFKAIEEGTPFKVNSSKCDDCGDCIIVCPVDAIEVSKVF